MIDIRPPFPDFRTDDDELFIRQTIDWAGELLDHDDVFDVRLQIAWRAAMIAERLAERLRELRAREPVDRVTPPGYGADATTSPRVAPGHPSGTG